MYLRVLCYCAAAAITAVTLVQPVRGAQEQRPHTCVPVAGETKLPGRAMAVQAGSDGCTVFVSVSANGAPLANGSRGSNGVAVLQNQGNRYTLSSFIPLADEPAEIVFDRRGTKLYVADANAGIAEIDAAKAKLIRYLGAHDGKGYFQIALSPDDATIFGGAMKSDRIVALDVRSGKSIASIATDHFPVGLALTGDGRYLFYTGTVARDPAHPEFHPVHCVYAADRTTLDPLPSEGTLSIVDALNPRARFRVLSRVRAACAPVRVALDEARRTVWMTARESNMLLGYRYDALLAHKPAAPLKHAVGTSPVGLALNAARGILAVGNSARFAFRQHSQTVVVFPLANLSGTASRPLRTATVGVFPRDISIDRSGRWIYAANFGSASLTVQNIQ